MEGGSQLEKGKLEEITEGPIDKNIAGQGWENKIKLPPGITPEMVEIVLRKDGSYWELKPEFYKDKTRGEEVRKEREAWET